MINRIRDDERADCDGKLDVMGVSWGTSLCLRSMRLVVGGWRYRLIASLQVHCQRQAVDSGTIDE